MIPQHLKHVAELSCDVGISHTFLTHIGQRPFLRYPVYIKRTGVTCLQYPAVCFLSVTVYEHYIKKQKQTRLWDNAQRDGRPAKYR